MDAGNPTPQAPPRLFALRTASVPLFTPLMVGFVTGLSTMHFVSLAHPLSGWMLQLTGLAGALAGTALSSSLLRRGIPDGLRLTDNALELLRGARIVRRVDLTRLREVSEFEVQTGKVLLVADRRRHITLPSFALAEARQYEDLTHEIVEALARIDPTGGVARGAVKTGRLRETIAQQPVRGTFVLSVCLGLASVLSFLNQDALAGTPYPAEEVGALSFPLVMHGEWYRVLSYLFVHATSVHLAVCVVGVLYVGSYLEKLLGWERVLLAFVAGGLGGAAGHLLLAPIVPAVGAGGGLFGLFGLLAAVSFMKRRLPPTLLPHPGFWLMTVLLALLLPTTSENAIPIDPTLLQPTGHNLLLLLRDLVSITSVDIGGMVAGFLAGAIVIFGVDVPASDDARRDMLPLAVLGCIALFIGLLGGVLLPKRGHKVDAEIITRALLDLPGGPVAGELQNLIAYPKLIDPKSKAETIDIAARLANMAVDNTGRESADTLDTLAVARYRQGQSGEAKSLVADAMRIAQERQPELLKALRQHAEDMEKGAALRPDPEMEDGETAPAGAQKSR